MRQVQTALTALTLFATAVSLSGCDGCSRNDRISEAELNQVLASAIAQPQPLPLPSGGRGLESIGHPINVVPGQGPKRIPHDAPRVGLGFPILPGEGIGPIRFGATRQTIERLMAAPCDDATETMCRYVGRAVEFKLENGVTTEMRLSRKGREAKRTEEGSIIEYGFFNGQLLPDLYFGMHPAAIKEHLGEPKKVERVEPPGLDGLSERHFYDGATLEYDLWSNNKLVLGAIVLTKSATAAAANAKAEAERAKLAAEREELRKKVPPTTVPR